MQPLNKGGLRSSAELLALCAASIALVLGGVYFVARSRARPSDAYRKMGGYDFGTHMNQEGSGPRPGERLDLQRFSGPNGEKITDVVAGDILMLATVDPDCGASWVARDELHDVRAHLARADVPYVLVSATTSRPPEEFHQFAASLGVDAPAFTWSSKDIAPPESLFTMVVPSHLLVRRDGMILRTWPGTVKSKKIRFQMVNQIVADTLDLASQGR